MTIASAAVLGPGTGEGLCAHGLFEEDDYRKLHRNTGVIISVIGDPVLRDTLESFSDFLSSASCLTLSPMTLTVGGSWYADLDLLVRQPLTMWTQLCPNTLVVRSDVTRAPLAVGAISYVQHTLGLSLKQTLRAAHISPRTYHSWKENLDRHPRIRSQGRLWQLHQLTEDLTETLGELGAQQWLAEDDSRLTRMMRGHFDNLVAEVYGSSVSAQDAVQNFDAALDERESKLHLQRRPLTRVKANPGDVAGPDT